MTKPEDACGRWPECRCSDVCDYWSGESIRPVEDDSDN